MKKGFILFIITALMLGIFSIYAFAEEKEDNAATDSVLEGVEESTSDAQGAKEESDADGTPEGSEENAFEYVYNLLLDHSSEIFSALACIFSAIMMLCYRKGILPLVKKALGIIRGGVDTLNEEAQRQSCLSDSAKQLIEEKLTDAKGILEKIDSSFATFDERLKVCEEVRDGEESFRKIISAQVELLYEIFMSATLPQYEKDRIGEMIGAMRSELVKKEC